MGLTSSDRVHLLSIHGHFLAYDSDNRCLIGTSRIDDPWIVYAEIGKSALFYVETAASTWQHLKFGREVSLSDEESLCDYLDVHPYDRMLCRFEQKRLFLSANPDGSVDFKQWKENYESFLIVPRGGIISRLLQERWYSRSKYCLATTRALPDFTLSIGHLTVSAISLEQHGIAYNNEIVIIYDKYCVESLIAFRPLVYFTAFGDESTFEALEICMMSLVTFGNYTGDFLVLSDREADRVLSYVPDSFAEKTHVRVVAAHDVIDYVNARFDFVSFSEFSEHQPVVYIDVDIICNASIDPILFLSLKGDAIYTRLEGSIELKHYGSTLIVKDPFPRIQKENGFNSGVIGFRNTSQAYLVFKATLASLQSHLENGLSRYDTEAYDQPVANYVFNAIGRFDVEALVQHVHPCLPAFDETMSSSGLVHFYGGVGASHKIERMRLFWSRLLSR